MAKNLKFMESVAKQLASDALFSYGEVKDTEARFYDVWEYIKETFAGEHWSAFMVKKAILEHYTDKIGLSVKNENIDDLFELFVKHLKICYANRKYGDNEAALALFHQLDDFEFFTPRELSGLQLSDFLNQVNSESVQWSSLKGITLCNAEGEAFRTCEINFEKGYVALCLAGEEVEK